MPFATHGFYDISLLPLTDSICAASPYTYDSSLGLICSVWIYYYIVVIQHGHYSKQFGTLFFFMCLEHFITGAHWCLGGASCSFCCVPTTFSIPHLLANLFPAPPSPPPATPIGQFHTDTLTVVQPCLGHYLPFCPFCTLIVASLCPTLPIGCATHTGACWVPMPLPIGPCVAAPPFPTGTPCHLPV